MIDLREIGPLNREYERTVKQLDEMRRNLDALEERALEIRRILWRESARRLLGKEVRVLHRGDGVPLMVVGTMVEIGDTTCVVKVPGFGRLTLDLVAIAAADPADAEAVGKVKESL